MQRSDNVFMLTLVDFLVQVIFFGVFVFVIYQNMESTRRQKMAEAEKDLDAVYDAAGVSNIIELNDELGKLAPVGLKGFNTIWGKQGGGGQVAEVKSIIEKAGGPAGLKSKLGRLAKLEQGLGKPPCLSQIREGKREVIPIATVVATASTITFSANTPELQRLLDRLGLNYDQVRSMGLAQFRRTFHRVIELQPDCRYSLVFREMSRLVDPRDAVDDYFYLMIRR